MLEEDDKSHAGPIAALSAREHADLATRHAQRAAAAADGGKHDRALVAAHVGAAIRALATENGNDLVARGAVHSALAQLFASIEGQDSSENAEAALVNAQAALSLFVRAHDEPRATLARVNLGNAYLARRAGAEDANVQQGIHHLEKAVTNLQAGSPAWLDAKGNLASAYQRRVIGVRGQNLSQAIQCIRDALAHVSRAQDPERWIDLQNNLANALVTRAQGAVDLRDAITHYQAALDATERERFPILWADLHSNLSLALSKLLEGDAVSNLAQSIDHLRLALEIYTAHAFPRSHLTTQRALGQKLLRAGRFEEAHTAFAGAIAVGRVLFADAFTWQGRQEELEDSGALFFRDAYCLLRLGRLDEALARLEEGRARVLNETLSVLDASGLAEDDAGRISKARELVRLLEAAHHAQASQAPGRMQSETSLKLKAARDAMVEAVEAVAPEKFGNEPLSAQILLAMIPATSIVIAPIVTESGTAVFVIPGGTKTLCDEHVLRLDAFTTHELHTLLVGDEGWLKAYREREENPGLWRGTIAATCRRLWDILIGPVNTRARELRLPN